MSEQVTVAFVGNHVPPYSTESHMAASFEAIGCRVARIQEGETPATEIPAIVKAASADMYFHIQTRGLAITGGTDDERKKMHDDIRALNIPTVAMHLDLFHGLDREDYVRTDPYFHGMDYFFSTDGGHDDKWKELGINHIWMPPGVYHKEAHDGQFVRAYASDVGFVGSHQHYAHEEHWPTRKAMLDAVRRKYGRRFQCWPRRAAVRGEALTNLYASIKVVVGDSCLAGQVRKYVSDRVMEVTGRGGFLIHPYVPGLEEFMPFLTTYPAGDWDALLALIDFYLTNDEERELVRKRNAEHTREHHTYKHRAASILKLVGLS